MRVACLLAVLLASCGVEDFPRQPGSSSDASTAADAGIDAGGPCPAANCWIRDEAWNVRNSANEARCGDLGCCGVNSCSTSGFWQCNPSKPPMDRIVTCAEVGGHVEGEACVGWKECVRDRLADCACVQNIKAACECRP